ncbi:sensor histidine kinase [Bacillus weihaiensis]|uniref:histidine kinase n=1 Tax=Bacillus weihaiensis TaxID=1547283 RepID=A0A1L3MTW7_9BACI|nr:HAMP domain-containing sensor histidine kinase [Bacillus weihaiensis]APH05769.1 hypothetical protein A9C19_14085 [Bacillus weihaiensis]
MKIRTLLLLANIISLLVILVFLSFAYAKMFFSNEVILILTIITLLAGILSIGVNLFITSPLLKSVKQMTREARKMANGDFNSKVIEEGPAEMKELAVNFNHMSEKIEFMFEELKKSERFKSELIANVSHDLRTPLSAIHSFVAALNDDIIEDEKTRKHYYRTILTETNRLSSLIEEVLELSELETNKIPYSPVPSSIDRMIIETLQQFERKLEGKGINITVSLEEDMPAIPLMPLHIKRVMTNFLQNAIHFSSLKSYITIRSWIEDDQFNFSIEDEGPGVPKEEQHEIFQRFYRVEKSRNKKMGGSGLGLAICKEIIELHDGKIGVQSDGVKGSIFWFILPIR